MTKKPPSLINETKYIINICTAVVHTGRFTFYCG